MEENLRCIQLQKKPSILSKVFKFILLLVIAGSLTLGLILIGVPKWLVFVIIILLYILYSAVWPAHIIYKSKSIKAIHRYIKGNTSQPIFKYAYALANDQEQSIESALKLIVNEYKDDDMTHIYGAKLAIYQNKSSEILEQAEKIEDENYKNYYNAYANVLKGHFDVASGYISQVQTPWMIHSLKAVEAKKRGNMEGFRDEAALSIESAVGIQRYVLHHTMRRLEN